MIKETPLYNIATGKAASAETEEFLLNIANIGDKERKKFIDECIEQPNPLEE